MKQQHISRAGRKAQIVLTLFDDDSMDLTRVVSAYGIAKAIGMKPSTHVKSICEELVKTKWLQSMQRTDFWGRLMTYYCLTTDAVQLLLERPQEVERGLNIVKSWFEQ